MSKKVKLIGIKFEENLCSGESWKIRTDSQASNNRDADHDPDESMQFLKSPAEDHPFKK